MSDNELAIRTQTALDEVHELLSNSEQVLRDAVRLHEQAKAALARARRDAKEGKVEVIARPSEEAKKIPAWFASKLSSLPPVEPTKQEPVAEPTRLIACQCGSSRFVQTKSGWTCVRCSALRKE